MSDARVVADGQAAQGRAVADGRQRRLRELRIASTALCTALLVEYGLGAGVNLYLKVPAADQQHGFWTALGRALTSQPVGLAVHAGFGLLLLIGGLNVIARAVLARHRIAVPSSVVAFLALAGAAAAGASFVDKGQAGASMAMAVLTGVALLCCVVNVLASRSLPRTSGTKARQSQGPAVLPGGPWPMLAGQVCGLTEVMFVSDERLLTVGFDTAALRLARIGSSGWLRGRSEAVYDGGMEYLLRVGPLGAVPGASKLVRVRLAEPVCRDGMISVGIRWEASGAGGRLFPALDADVRLSHEGGQDARVTLTGSYRPPLGTVGGGLDRLLLHAVASATIRALLATIADALEGRPASPWQAAEPWQPEPGPAPVSR